MISIKSEEQIRKLREGGRKLFLVMKELEKSLKPGITTLLLDETAERVILKLGGTPAFKNYGSESGNPYPASICASLNDEIVHGIPSESVFLKEGDILKIDIGMKWEGMFTDMARTFSIGKISDKAEKIKRIVEESFWKGVERIKNGAYLFEYSKAVQEHVEKNGFSVVRDLVGHGIGTKLHEDPQIMNYFDGYREEIILKSGMVLALEPMINEGGFETVVQKDGWVFKTKDGKLSAHYENTILVTDDGYEVLTSI